VPSHFFLLLELNKSDGAEAVPIKASARFSAVRSEIGPYSQLRFALPRTMDVEPRCRVPGARGWLKPNSRWPWLLQLATFGGRNFKNIFYAKEINELAVW